jgi:enamine deaminase RidA (YjgF/YER057c/UK114 family)
MNIMAASTAVSTATLQLEYLSSAQIASQSAAWWQSVLGLVGFETAPAIEALRIPVAASMTPVLGANDICEVWRVAAAQLSSGETRQGHVRYRYCDDLLFGSLTIAEPRDEDEARALLRATETAYHKIFDVLNRTEHRHLIRIWNYLPEINREIGGHERYRLFNAARQLAFRNSGRATTGAVPAACALGSPAGSPISIYFLAARNPPKMIENPRQTSAYFYPPQFGKHPPIFSRACVWGEPGGAKLFVSGTASIVGHESIHPGDVAAQTRETMVNIGALLDEANRVVGSARFSAADLKLKVYVRRPEDLAAIKASLSLTLSPATHILYLQADVCREDLLVEIEAVG